MDFVNRLLRNNCEYGANLWLDRAGSDYDYAPLGVRLEDGCTIARKDQDGAKMGKDGAKMGQDGAKMGQDGAEIEPRWRRDGPRWSQEGPR